VFVVFLSHFVFYNILESEEDLNSGLDEGLILLDFSCSALIFSIGLSRTCDLSRSSCFGILYVNWGDIFSPYAITSYSFEVHLEHLPHFECFFT